MNKRKAEAEGLRFTGIYHRQKVEVKQRIAKERIARPKARIILVTVPDSKYSRGGVGCGYSSYADNVYFAYDTIKQSYREINAHESCMNAIRSDCEMALKAQKDKYYQSCSELDKAKNLIESK